MSNSTINITGALAEYYSRVGYREAAILRELREETRQRTGNNAGMQIAPEQGAFMGLIAQLSHAQAILEIGTFTGYSSLAMALAAPQAHITCVDVSEEFTSLARSYWQKAGCENRITLRLDGGAAAITDLIAQGQVESFDLCFIDADKTGYDVYYEGALRLLKHGGLILIDNVLWDGDVADATKTDVDTEALRALNRKIEGDDRVEMVIVPIGDGLTLARKT